MPPAVQPESTMKSLVIYRTKPTIGTITPAVGQKSSFGNQMYSTQPSNPSYGMGTGTRANSDKRFISNAHVAKDQPQWTPGPGAYQLHSQDMAPMVPPPKLSTGARPYGFQAETRKKTVPAWRFPKDDRWARLHKANPNPGPGEYTP